MADMKTILYDMVCAIVDYPDQVSIDEETKGDEIILTLSVAQSDMGKVIGRHGKIARSLRLIMRAAAVRANAKVSVEIKE